MHWRTTRWKDWDAKCSCGNTKPRCPRNPHWRRKLAAHGNCWSNKRNRAGRHARLGDETLASVCGRRAGQVERRRRGAPSGTKPERNARRRAADGSHPLLRPAPCKLVTSARFVRRIGRGREGDGADRKPVKPYESCVGHDGCKVQQNEFRLGESFRAPICRVKPASPRRDRLSINSS